MAAPSSILLDKAMRWTAASSVLFVPAALVSCAAGSRLLAATVATLAATSTVHHWHFVDPESYAHGHAVRALDVALARGIALWGVFTVPTLPSLRMVLGVSAGVAYASAVYCGAIHGKPCACYDPASGSFCRRTVALHASMHLVVALLIGALAPFAC